MMDSFILTFAELIYITLHCIALLVHSFLQTGSQILDNDSTEQPASIPPVKQQYY